MMRLYSPAEYTDQCRCDFAGILAIADDLLCTEFGCADSYEHSSETRAEITATIAMRAPIPIAEAVTLLAAREIDGARRQLRDLLATIKEVDPQLFAGNPTKQQLLESWVRAGLPWSVAKGNAARSDLKEGRHHIYEVSHQSPRADEDLPDVEERSTRPAVDGGHEAHHDLGELRASLAKRLKRRAKAAAPESPVAAGASPSP